MAESEVARMVKSGVPKGSLDAIRKALQARQRAKEGDLSAFLLPLVIAITKDVFDIFGVILIGYLLTIPAGLYLFIFMWGRGKWKLRIIAFFLTLLDLIPVASVIPMSTIYVLYGMYHAKKDSEEAKKELEKFERAVPELTRQERIAQQQIRNRMQQATREGKMYKGEMLKTDSQIIAEREQAQAAQGGAVVASAMMMDGARSGGVARPQTSTTQVRGQAANDAEYNEREAVPERAVSGSDIAPVRPAAQAALRSQSSGAQQGTVQGISAPRASGGENNERPTADDMRKKMREWLKEDKEREKRQAEVPMRPSLATDQATIVTQTTKPVVRSGSGNIQPDLESDPTLTLYSRVNNPDIQKQMVDLLLRNEDYRVTEKIRKLVDITDENGKLLFDPDTSYPIMESIEIPRFSNYVKKTRPEVEKEVQDRVNSITQLGGEKNVVYLHPEEKWPSTPDAAYDRRTDEVWASRKVSIPGGSNEGNIAGGNLSTKQLEAVLAHEKGHQLRRYHSEEYLNKVFRDSIDWENLSNSEKEEPRSIEAGLDAENLRDYMHASEIAERMSQLKNYFGFKGNEKFTKEHLDYARAHYMDDVFDNNMKPFFRAITPEKEPKFLEAMNTFGI